MTLQQQLQQILNDLQGVWLETSLMIGAILLLVFGLFRPKAMFIRAFFLAVLAIAFVIDQGNILSGSIMLDSLWFNTDIKAFDSLFIISSALLLLFRRTEHTSEFYFLILSLLAGSLFMMKGNNLLIIYLAIELASFSSYILTNFSFSKKSFEAGLKYLLFGAICSAIMLFGIGLIYGTQGSIYLTQWNSVDFQQLAAQLGLLMFMMGIFFKISIFPAQVWVPATYEQAPIDAVAFMSVVPKLAGVMLLARIFQLDVIAPDGRVVLMVSLLGIVTLGVGTLGAFTQTNVRRMVSFGAIAHSGFLLPFAFLDSPTAQDSFWYYSVVYVLMNFAVFYCIGKYEENDMTTLEEYSYRKSSTWMGASYTLILVSLVGLPPLAGFNAKLFLFTSLWEAIPSAGGGYLVAYFVMAIAVTVGSLFFYFRVPKAIFLSTVTDTQSIKFNSSTKITATLFCIVLLLLFFVPDLVMEAKRLLNNIHE